MIDVCPDNPIPRRTAVRQLMLGTAASVFGGIFRPAVLSAADPVESIGTLNLKTGDFPALLNAGGSVRLNVGLDAPIVLSRAAAGVFYAVSARCTHQGCIVNAYDAGSDLIRCGCHGSTYQIDGTLAGGPAERSLDTYAASFDGVDAISVRLPGLTFAAREIAGESAAGETRRLRLVFNPQPFTTYQVWLREDLNATARLVPFGLSATGVLSQTGYVNRNLADLTPVVTLYVELTRSKGFFQIVQVVTKY